MLKNKKYGGFTLLEMLVVVLIIGILAGIALPQYEMAVTKAKVASILPIMRRWYDALAEYKLQHGYYYDEDNEIYPDGSDLGVNWPSDWKNGDEDSCGDSSFCHNDYWNCSLFNTDDGSVACSHNNGAFFVITMQHPDDYSACGKEENRGKIICFSHNAKGEKICKSLGKPSGKFNDKQCTVIGG